MDADLSGYFDSIPHAELMKSVARRVSDRRWGAEIVNYADDFVICCRGTAQQAMEAMRDLMTRLRLTVNETKTRLCRIPNETVDFLGYTFGRCHDRRTGRAYIGTRPSKKRIRRICEEIRESTGRKWTFMAADELERLTRNLPWAKA